MTDTTAQEEKPVRIPRKHNITPEGRARMSEAGRRGGLKAQRLAKEKKEGTVNRTHKAQHRGQKGYDKVSAAKIASLLENRAGWDSRQKGSHIILSKPGRKNITLTEHMNQNVIANVKRELGVDVAQLINKSARGRNAVVGLEEYRQRLTLARQLYEIGFDTRFILKNTATEQLYNETQFSLSLFDRYGVDEIVRNYVEPWRASKVKNWAQESVQAPPKVAEPEPQPEPVIVAEPEPVVEAAPVVETVDNTGPILELLGEISNKIDDVGLPPGLRNDIVELQVTLQSAAEHCQDILNKLDGR